MRFKTENRTKTVKQIFEQKRKSISREVEDRIEEVFRKSEHSMWLNRVLRPDDDSYDEFIVGFRKGLAVQLLPLWKDGSYQLKIKLNARPLRDHLLNFLSAPVRGKSYKNAELDWLKECLESEENAELFCAVNVPEETAEPFQERTSRFSKRSNIWFNKLIKANYDAVLDVLMGVEL